MNFARAFLILALFAAPVNVSTAADPSQPPARTAEDARREQAIADFTQKMKDANYPALFDRAAQEFNVPPDVLKAVSFTETRWDQLEWPPGETASPDNGMPHPYGIMSLWDNQYFGHSLQQAAALIGQDPEVLKTNAFQNMRGGAALLRQIYDQTPKPADAPNENQIESWRKAIVKYSGIPQPELSEQHALRVYENMNEGYHQYGIEWKKHPVTLGPMREDVARIQKAARARLEANMKAEKDQPHKPLATALYPGVAEKTNLSTAALPHEQSEKEKLRQRRLLLILIAGLVAVGVIYQFTRKQPTPAKQ